MSRKARRIFHRMEEKRVLVFIGEIVANSPLGEDEFGLVGITLNLLAQSADMNVYSTCVAGVIVLPYGFRAETRG